MSKFVFVISAAMMLSSPAFAQHAPSAANPTGNPTLDENKNTPGPSAGTPATGTNDTPYGSSVPGGGTATGGPVGGSMSGQGK